MKKRSQRSRAYTRWWAMVDRCTNPDAPMWRYYGGRGITVCAEWRASFDAYYAHTGDKPAPGMSVDRIDNDGNYEPGNVRWATASEQARNKGPYTLRTECSRGHLYNDENTRVTNAKSRQCRACARLRDRARVSQQVEANRRRRAAKRAAAA